MSRIELLYCDGCPSYERALDQLKGALDQLGAEHEIEVRHVGTVEQAQRERFIGSPTIRVDGRDLFPEPGASYGLTCRLYRLRDRRASPLPDRRDLNKALAQAVGQR